MRFLRSFALLLLTSSIARADFTTVWTEISTGFDGNSYSVWEFKAPKVRVSIVGPHGPVFSIIDCTTGEMTVYLESQKIAQRRNMAEEEKKARAEMAAKDGEANEDPQPKATGVHEKVGKWNCEIYSRQLRSGTTLKTWVTRDIPEYREIVAEMKLMAKAMQAAGTMAEILPDGIVVKEVYLDRDGKTKRSRTMQTISRDAVQDKVFAPMPGYQLVEPASPPPAR
jgi:hypothetical protein